MSFGDLVPVNIEESEVVSRHGTTRTTYLVQVDRVWRPAHGLDRVVQRSMPSRPGVVWARQLELCLRVGTLMEKVVEMTRREENLDTGDVLFGRSRGLRHTRRQLGLEVAEGGRLRERRQER